MELGCCSSVTAGMQNAIEVIGLGSVTEQGTHDDQRTTCGLVNHVCLKREVLSVNCMFTRGVEVHVDEVVSSSFQIGKATLGRGIAIQSEVGRAIRITEL